MKNILITSFGTSWSIIPELIGFTNYKEYDLYKNHPLNYKINNQRKEYGIEPIDEIWLAATNGNKVEKELILLKEWFEKNLLKLRLKIFSYENLVELDTVEEIESMADLIYRVVLKAKSDIDGGKLYLSLAGGRKNMSANMQTASEFFGCDALIHVMSNGRINDEFSHETNYKGFNKIPGKEIENFYPFVLGGVKKESNLMFIDPPIKSEMFKIDEELLNNSSIELFKELNNRQSISSNSLFNLYKSLNKKDNQNSFAAFQMLHPSVREQLRNEKIAVDSNNKEKDLVWIKKLPKAELHCHFGGVLLPNELIDVALENHDEIEEHINKNKEFAKWIVDLKQVVRDNDLSKLPKYNPKENIKKYWHKKGVPEHVAISAFITLFKDNQDLLRNYIYNSVGCFKGIGIEHYEKLGDLQGSSLLQNEKSIRKTCQIIVEQCKKENVKYFELRCSPINSTRAGLKSKNVVEIMMDELKEKDTIFKLIFIASRHGEDKPIQAHIDLALSMIESNELFKTMFVGFDLAGAESAKSPEELRGVFLKILEQSIPTTIHAGEDMDVKNIWEAVYHLSAERIGHGLTLNDDVNLKRRIKERKIAIELCPSSNDQIIGYRNYSNGIEESEYKIYPLREYFDDGLKVTINTDDPGISATTISEEYYKAAAMTKGGLSKWEILQIIRNGFKYGFLPINEKKQLLLKVEQELFDLLK